MGESRNHIELVKIAYAYIKKCVPTDKQPLIQIDSADSIRPTMVKGRAIPDVQFWDGTTYIIGEAKTINDFERDHSKMQYDTYIAECEKFQGRAMLVIAVPWQVVITAKNYFRRKKKELGLQFEIIILNELGGVFSV